MKQTIIALAALSLAGSAFATYCTDGSLIESHPGGNCSVPIGGVSTPGSTPSTSTSTSTATGTQRQQQTQAQGQRQQQVAAGGNASSAGGTGTSQANGNGVNAGAGAGANAGAGAGSNNATSQMTTVNTGDAAGSGDSYRSLALALPSVPMTPPSFVAGAVVTTTVSACGPLQRVVAEPIYGEHNGLFSNSQIFLGNTERTELYLNERGEVQPYTAIGGRWFGHQVIFSTAALGVSSASNLAIGGGGSGGGWGQGGGGSSGAMQRMVTTVQLRFCDVGAVPVPLPTPIVFEQRPVPPPPKRKPVRRVARPCPAGQVLMCRPANP